VDVLIFTQVVVQPQHIPVKVGDEDFLIPHPVNANALQEGLYLLGCRGEFQIFAYQLTFVVLPQVGDIGFKQCGHQRLSCPLTVRIPSSVVAVIRSRWATAMSFFMASVTVWPHTTSTWERRSRSRLMSMPLLCSSGTASLRNRGRYSVGQMGEKPASYTARQYRAACSVFL